MVEEYMKEEPLHPSEPGVERHMPARRSILVVICLLSIGVLGAVLAGWFVALPVIRPTLEMMSNVGHVWQQSLYRITLLLLLLKLFSPLIVLLLAGCFVLLWYLWRRYLGNEQEALPHFPPPLEAPSQLLLGEETQTEQERSHTASHAATYRRQQILTRDRARSSQGKKKHFLQRRQRSRKRKLAALQRPPTVLRRGDKPEKPVGGEQRSMPNRPFVTLTLFGNVRLILHDIDGSDWHVPVSFPSKRVMLLAYLAVHQEVGVSREQLLVDVFGNGLHATHEQLLKLAVPFHTHKKYLRADIRKIVSKANVHAGREVLPPDLDILTHTVQGQWFLSSCCHVLDLEQIEAQHKIIERALQAGNGHKDKDTATACQRLIEAYKGGFLQEFITTNPDMRHLAEFAWIREPFNRYRSYFLQALWYLAESSRLAGMRTPAQQSHRFEQAASLYLTYALTSCSTFTGKISPERMIVSERALARSCLLYGKLGNRDRVDAAFSTYVTCMQQVLKGEWEPDGALVRMIEQAKQGASCSLLEEYIVPEPC